MDNHRIDDHDFDEFLEHKLYIQFLIIPFHRARSDARELLLETHGSDGNNVLHTAVVKEAKHSINIILRLIEKSGEQEVGMK